MSAGFIGFIGFSWFYWTIGKDTKILSIKRYELIRCRTNQTKPNHVGYGIAVLTIRSVKIILVSNTDFFENWVR